MRHALTTGLLHGECDAKVSDQRRSIVQENVLRLDVAVNDVLPMRVVECTGYFTRNTGRLGNRQLAFAVKSRAQCLAGHERHHVVQQSVRDTAVEQRENVRMLQARRGANFAQEPFAAERGTEIGMQHLYRDITIVLEIVREVHGGHASGAELAVEAVAVGQRSGES